MGVINLPKDQLDAIEAIDTKELDRLIRQAVQTESPGALRGFLGNCGTYISNRLYAFQRALATHREARSPRKRDRTADELRKAAYDLSYAVASMQLRVEEDRKDDELFHIEDRILPPFRYGKHLSVSVSFRWRRSISEAWQYGDITFTHEYDPRADYSVSTPKRKLSAAKQEQQLQKQLSHTWEDLMKRALWSVREYFKKGGDGAQVPKSFKAIPDSYYRTLNNFSTQFWRDQPQ